MPLTAIFRWVRGDLIGRGTFGNVYLALDVNVGEMIAVRQVEIPKTVSERTGPRQVAAVEAVKWESEVLKDLDHPNIVQYLGFEETPAFLSLTSGGRCAESPPLAAGAGSPSMNPSARRWFCSVQWQ